VRLVAEAEPQAEELMKKEPGVKNQDSEEKSVSGHN
jgi:hypothetical protein